MRSADSLQRYRAKRRFDVTSEPAGRIESGAKSGHTFVVQKHDARRLHYDFRLELDGVLKSWAIPKGPSLDPAVKRMAVEVEDHPLEYADFEGKIPEGEYGAGNVIVWDRGEWIPNGDPAEALRKGKLEFELRGTKLTGRWNLVRLRKRAGEQRTSWLLIKGRDDKARSEDEYDVTEAQPNSVKTHKPLAPKGKAARTAPVRGEGASKPASKPAAPAPVPELPRGVRTTHAERVIDASTGIRRRARAPWRVRTPRSRRASPRSPSGCSSSTACSNVASDYRRRAVRAWPYGFGLHRSCATLMKFAGSVRRGCDRFARIVGVRQAIVSAVRVSTANAARELVSTCASTGLTRCS